MFIHVNRFRSGWTNVTILFPQLCHLNDCFFEWTQLCFFISFILCAFSTFAAWKSMKTTFFTEFFVEIISVAEKLLWYFSPSCYFPPLSHQVYHQLFGAKQLGEICHNLHLEFLWVYCHVQFSTDDWCYFTVHLLSNSSPIGRTFVPSS